MAFQLERQQRGVNQSPIPRLEVGRLVKIVYARLPEEQRQGFLEEMDKILNKYYPSARMKPVSPNLVQRYKIRKKAKGPQYGY